MVRCGAVGAGTSVGFGMSQSVEESVERSHCCEAALNIKTRGFKVGIPFLKNMWNLRKNNKRKMRKTTQNNYTNSQCGITLIITLHTDPVWVFLMYLFFMASWRRKMYSCVSRALKVCCFVQISERNLNLWSAGQGG